MNTKTNKSIRETLNKMLTALGDNVAEPIPEGWLTIEQIAEQSGRSLWWARKTLKRLVDNKLIETKKVRASIGDGNCLVRIYKI